ncbi:uncharacterized protein JCM15063_003764 [Sporobolomyces koalae]|uniref:uncharacterized protein n=1 Tax=Sporobolomyces koalae TaxID=500713 RepID=UPI0031764216
MLAASPVVLSLLSLATVSTALHHQSVQTPAHLLAKRRTDYRRSLLQGQLTVGNLLNVSVTAVDQPLLSSNSSKTATPTNRSTCFPLHSEGFKDGKVPNMSRQDWWCQDRFSYPLEIADCSDPSNLYPKISRDLGRMKSEFGATFVRPYGVECRDVSIWENLVKACIEHGMALIVQVWWGFQSDQTLWTKSQESIYELFETSSYRTLAPYVVYSASFGSEPIGDWVDGDNFVQDLTTFRSKMNSYGIPVGISEDWDRPDRMKQGDQVAGIGAQVLETTDVAQLHVMPYYHLDQVPYADGAWEYTRQQVQWARKALKQPTMITESMWSSQQGGSHGRGAHDEESTIANYNSYWDSFASNCKFFKEQQTGWFVHTFDDSMEPYFGMVDWNGTTKINGWKPERC